MKILPWSDWSEWKEIMAWLFSDDANMRVAGINRVKAWRARGRLPVAVDATAALIEVALAESSASHPPGRSTQELRMMYSMVITRAINGLVEGQQTKFYAEPVNVIASRLGISQWLVDIRHEATHSQLPSLQSLRMGAQHLLDWLYQEYWKKQEKDLDESKLAAVRILNAYESTALRVQEESPNMLFKACRDETGGGTPAATAGSRSLANLNEALEGVVESITPSFLSSFLVPALLSSSFLGHQLPQEEGEADNDKNNNSSICWNKHRQLYLPLLVRLQRRYPGFMHSMMRELLLSREGRGQEQQQQGQGGGAAAWLDFFKSRDWHSYFPKGRQEAVYSLRGGGGTRLVGKIQFNLRDKRPENWTTAEAEFMRSPTVSTPCLEMLGLAAAAPTVEDNKKGEGGTTTDDWGLCTAWTPCPLGVLPIPGDAV